ncbi:flagellar type III secretion system protein FlhB [Undibacterium sp.]|jgi:flagellar biosynthetic protein FlhB|uniref:EscU/YscU/HrcU family type III secretion system export apparatus switch protein n=1 Tax=Undibacterium sp. TaxID=1914977 RepID=UPI002BFB27B4|nr:flagellar type III secretion system protein FlhB [Undibacterium sp.]HTD03756.1 flagellar type III secretion system protein FlhB [Undibacterium sp.]
MAETSQADKSEKASQQKLKKSREEGQVVRSRDLSTAIGILVSLKLFVWLVPSYLQDFRSLFGQSFLPLSSEGALDNAMSIIFTTAMGLLIKMVLPLFVVPLSVVLGSLVPGGWVISTSHWMPKLERLSPAKNLGRLVSPKHGFELLISILKAGMLGAVLFHMSRAGVSDYVQLQNQPLDQALTQGAELMLDGVMALCSIFILFAVIDVPAQAFFFMRGQRMSKQEIKEEHKSNEGRPELKQRIRQLQHQIARRSVRKTVPTADVVIVNPEHYAVALKYDEDRAEAPFVVAKGVDEMALYIRQVAADSGIETLSLPPLARAIYNTSQVNQQIPVPLYKAVSQVLNYVLQLQAFRNGRRAAQPLFPNEMVVPSHLSEVSPS